MAKNVVFDESSAQRIADAVRWVEQYSTAEDPPPDDPPATSEPRKIIRGTFAGAWAKGATASVNYVADNGSSNQKDAANYFTTVGSAGSTTDCVIALIGSEWVLISADPAATTGQTDCMNVVTSVDPAGNLTLLSAITPTGQVVTGVACVNGNLTVTTASLTDRIGYTERTVRLEDLATVTTNNLTLPPQAGCS